MIRFKIVQPKPVRMKFKPASVIRGEDGITPHIGENGNWWLDDTDTGIAATGPQGNPGKDGEDGARGAMGFRGTGILKVTTEPSSYTASIGSYTPKYRIAASTVRAESGVSEVRLGDIIQYSYYQYKVDRLDAAYAYISETRESIRGADGKDGLPGKDGADGQPGKDGIDGKDGSDGAPGKDGQPGSPGKDGRDGEDGKTPHIGTNGNWYVGTSDTGIAATGPAGEDGKDGQPGKDGAAGKDGADGSPGKDGKNGVSPHIGTNGNWFVGDTDTGIAATGPAGTDGQDGATGKAGQDGVTPHIGSNGNWYIGTVDTGTAATGPAGRDGTNGKDGEPGKDGADGQPGSPGKDGTDGKDGKDGADGQRGTGTLKVTTAPSSYTTAIGSYTPKYRIALSTVKTQSGKDEVLIGDLIQYSYYQYHVDYLDDTYAYISATRVSIRGATGADGATGPEGPQGPAGSDAAVTADNIKSALGYTPADAADLTTLNNEKVDKTGISLGIGADGLIYIHVNGAPVGTGIAQGASGDVIGYVDENNNIVLTGTLPEATYSVKYEMEDGTTVDIGELSFAPDGPINWADPTSADWVTNARLSTTSGTPKTGVASHIVTNYIPAKMGDVLRVKGLNLKAYVSSYYSIVATYKSDKTYQGFVNGAGGSASTEGGADNITVTGDISTVTLLKTNKGVQVATSETAYIRIDGVLLDGYTANDVIITINEEIV